MALNNQRRAPRHLALGLADPQIIVPETAYAEAQQNNRRSLIGRVLSPRRLDLHGLLDRLPLDWHADRSRLRGRINGGGKFQFLFETERDMEMVLWSGPYTYDGWLVVLQRWEDEPGPDFLKSIPMWVKIRGIPVRYLSEGTVREIVKGMGEIMEVDLDDKTFDVRFVRARVDVSVETRLCFKKVVRFESGEVKVVSLSYEDIACNTARFRFCRNCGGLKHLKKSCKLVWVDVPDPNERALSPPPPDASFDGSAENNGERGTSSGLDGVDGGDGKQVQSEMVGTSAEGSKRKFEAVEEDDGVLEKRIRGSSDETPNHLEKNDLMKVITVRDLGS
ncbi:hypothetical protein HID58_002706 [Brassica napus]|uniref:DUF4283 domain-containing protein n=1 Tax=Brassica napus TaxID=3708 RepID=A0ABQ8EN06_BRANA|nr:hypothetical protein HID58_002706 [Brassica napus]